MPCQRCGGRMFWDGEEEAHVCLNCGHIDRGPDFVPLPWAPEQTGGQLYHYEGHGREDKVMKTSLPRRRFFR